MTLTEIQHRLNCNLATAFKVKQIISPDAAKYLRTIKRLSASRAEVSRLRWRIISALAELNDAMACNNVPSHPKLDAAAEYLRRALDKQRGFAPLDPPSLPAYIEIQDGLDCYGSLS